MNKVFVNEHGIIEAVVVGDQTLASICAMAGQVKELIESQKQAGKPALILNNLLDAGNVPSAARKYFVDCAKLTDYDRMASVGNSAGVRLTSNLTLQAIGRSKKARFFEDYDEAVAWLRSE